VRALQRAIPNFLRYVASVIPVLLGFALMGTVIFGHYVDYFEDIDDALVTLFSCMNGDSVHEVFDYIFGFNLFLGWLGRIYLAVYIILFVCAVLNIFTLIMEDAFFSLKRDAEAKLKSTDVAQMNDDQLEDAMDVHGNELTNVNDEEDEKSVVISESFESSFEKLLKFAKNATRTPETSIPDGTTTNEQVAKLQQLIYEYAKTLKDTDSAASNYRQLLQRRVSVLQ